MFTVGKILKKARERKALTYKEVSQATYIKPEYIEKLENDDFSGFKSPTFVKGFIRTYADFLDLDIDKVLAIYRRQVGEDEQPLKVYNKKEPKKAIVLSPIHLAAIILIVFFVGIVGYLLKLYIKAGQPPRLTIVEPKQEHITVDKEKITIKGITEPNVVVKVNNEEVQVKEDNTFSTELALQKGDNVITVEAYKLHLEDKKTTKKLVVTYAAKESKKPTPTPKPKSKKQKFTVKTKDNVWIQIIADSTQVDVGVKANGYEKTFTAEKEVIVKSGIPSYTEFYIGDKKLNLPPVNALGEGWKCVNTDGNWECN